MRPISCFSMSSKSQKYTVAQAYERSCTSNFGSNPAGIKLYSNYGFELNSDLQPIVEVIQQNTSIE